MTPGSNTVTLSGTGQQDLTGTLNFNGLTINNSVAGDAIIINDAVTVSGVFTLTDGIVNTSSGSLSLASATASISGGSNASFVNGPMIYTGVVNTSVTFPVGKVDEIHQVDVSVTGVSANYTAEYFASSARALGYTLPASIDRVSGVGYWTITNGSTAVTTASVTLYYNVDDEVTDAPNLRIAKDDGAGNWVDIGGTGSGSPTGNITSNTNFTAFSEFVLANGLGGTNPLPVEWLSFAGKQVNIQVDLTWQTASESDNDFFTIERSLNGFDFWEIGTLPGSGTTHSVSSYQFIDDRPISGIGYYRIKQTDYDVKFDYSRIIAVKFDPFENPELKNTKILIYPNPVEGNVVRIIVNNKLVEEEMELSVIDIEGRIYYLETIHLSKNSLDINIEKSILSPGIYTIRMKGLSGVYTGRMIVQ